MKLWSVTKGLANPVLSIGALKMSHRPGQNMQGMACKIAIAFANGILKIAIMKQHVSITSITPRANTNFINFFGKKNNGNLKRNPKNIKHDTTISPLMKID